jgi:hypothetical protein
MYTVSNSYFATGEGVTHMVLFTKGYGEGTRPDNALATFEKLFGSYFTIGAEVKEGLHFDFHGAALLINAELRAKLENWAETAGNLEYHASLHVNLS